MLHGFFRGSCFKDVRNSFLYSLGDCSEPLSFNPRAALTFPLYLNRVIAGFPSPADDYLQESLDLNEHLIHHREATFFVRATGASMQEEGIFPGDLLIVDRALIAKAGSIVIAIVDGELLIQRLLYRGEKAFLIPGDSKLNEIEMIQEREFSIWGVVTTVIHSVV